MIGVVLILDMGFMSILTSIFLFLLFTVGLIHGANDYYLINRETDNAWKLPRFLMVYLGIAALTGVLFYLDPFIALNIFILVSAYHFGEEHIHPWISSKNIAIHLQCFFYGLSVFALLFLANAPELVPLFGSNGFKIDIISWNYILTLPFIVIQFILAFGNTLQGKLKWTAFFILQLSLALLYWVFLEMDLLLGFLFYFVLWHSVPSVISQLKDLNLTALKSVRDYFYKALPFYLPSLIISVVFLVMVEKQEISMSFIVFVSAITTIPHVVIFAWLRK